MARAREWVVEISRIETVQVVVSESDPPRYSLNVDLQAATGSSDLPPIFVPPAMSVLQGQGQDR